MLDQSALPARDAVEGDHEVVAPMTGKILHVFVEQGQRVSEDDRICVLEAMKMEHVLRAPRDGIIAEIDVVEGEQIDARSLIARIDDVDDPS